MAYAEMKPEYSYSYKKEYSFWIMVRNTDKNQVAVLTVLRRHIPGYETQPLETMIAIENANYFYDVYSESEYRSLLLDLEKAGAKVEVNKSDVYKIARSEVYIPERTLTKMGEYSLALWAEANQIQEAYRLCVKMSFHQPFVWRAWFDGQVWLTLKSSASDDENADNKIQSEIRTGEIRRWSNLTTFMHQHFWTDENWDLHEGLDGVSYHFEGWKAGTYKAKYAWSPNGIDSAYEAKELFGYLFLP